MMVKHTCASGGRSSCSPCMQIEVDLWDAINRYAVTVGGDPGQHVYGNVPRMQAVADVGAVIRKLVAQLPGAQEVPTNPDCAGTIGTVGACGSEGYYCSDRCWAIGRLKAARAQVAEYEQRLGSPAARPAGDRMTMQLDEKGPTR